MANVYSKAIELTDTSNGHKINYTSFGLTEYKSFKYLMIHDVSVGAIDFKFGEDDDWVTVEGTEFPLVFDNIAFNEIWIKPDQTLTVNLVAFLV